MKNKVYYLIVIILVLLSAVSIVTYSYFTANVQSNDIKNVDVSSGGLNIRIDDNSVDSSEISPIYDTDYEMLAYHKDFEIISDSSLNSCAKLYLHINDISESLKSEYLKYKLIGENINISGDFSSAKLGEDLLLLDNIYLKKATTSFFDLYIWISYQDNVDQLDMLGTKINAHLVVSGVDSKTEEMCNKSN